jgi:hypothetical protein|tara:strand:+ start:32 stop:508 length:477 start_codon:yes stop_codon:yes gene_type:complete
MGYEIGSKRGVANHYGVRGTDNQYGGQDNSVGKVKEASWTFDWDKLPTYTASNLEQVLPANCTVLSAHLRVLTAGAAGSSTAMTVGLTTTAGVSVDPDGLAAAAQLDNTAVTTKGTRTAGAGALIGKTIGTAACEVVVAMSVALTAGRFELVVKYQYN